MKVECYAGYRDEETPRRFYLGKRCVEVTEILDRWLDPEHRYFKLRGDDNGNKNRGRGVNRESFDHSGLYRRWPYGGKREYTDKYVGTEMAWFQVIFHGEKN